MIEGSSNSKSILRKMPVEFTGEVILKVTGYFGWFLRVNYILVFVIILTIYDAKSDGIIIFSYTEPVLDILVIEVEAFKCLID